MSVGIQVGSIIDEIGSSDFFYAFFSTVSSHCEPNGWGSRFPALMTSLYDGSLEPQDVSRALTELAQAKVILSNISPDKVVWDFENHSVQPPWGKNISASITSLGNYFVTSTGRDLFAVLDEALNAALKDKVGAQIV